VSSHGLADTMGCNPTRELHAIALGRVSEVINEMMAWGEHLTG